MDYLVIMRMGDPKDLGLQRKRAELRDEHLARASGYRERGHLVIGRRTDGRFRQADRLDGDRALRLAQRVGRLVAGRPRTIAGVYTDIEIIPFRIADHYPQAKR